MATIQKKSLFRWLPVNGNITVNILTEHCLEQSTVLSKLPIKNYLLCHPIGSGRWKICPAHFDNIHVHLPVHVCWGKLCLLNK